jgi:integrase/recombinase XerD
MSHLSTFLQMMAAERHASENTLASYGRDLQEYHFFSHQKNQDVTTADAAHIQAFLAYLLKEKKITPRSQMRKLSALRQFYRFLCQEGVVKENPTHLIDSPKKGSRLPNVLSEEEVLDLLNIAGLETTPEGIRLSAQIELLYASGMRITELISLPLNAVMIDQQRKIRDHLMVKGKGNKERLVPLNRLAIQALEKYLEVRPYFVGGRKESAFLFPIDPKGRGVDNRRNGHMTRQRFGQCLKQLARETGIAEERVSPHVLRHSFATHLLRRGVDLRVLQELMGHASIVSTEVYTHVNEKAMRELVEECHPLARC